MINIPLMKSEIPGLSLKQGKVRDVYDLGDQLLIVASDRISAFDWNMPNGIPDKGRILTQISLMWFEQFDIPHHLLSTDLSTLDLDDSVDLESLEGRSMIVKKTKVVPFECVVRGYLAGSGWKDYQKTGAVCGIELPEGLVESDKFPEPIFTPATKAEDGQHDENVSFEYMAKKIGEELATQLKDYSIKIYQQAADFAAERGIILADTKFEFGILDGEVILIDEVLTPDSSRFWPAEHYKPGCSQPSFDKQFVRNWLETTDWDKNSEPPTLPWEIVEQTRDLYLDAYLKLMGTEFKSD